VGPAGLARHHHVVKNFLQSSDEGVCCSGIRPQCTHPVEFFCFQLNVSPEIKIRGFQYNVSPFFHFHTLGHDFFTFTMGKKTELVAPFCSWLAAACRKMKTPEMKSGTVRAWEQNGMTIAWEHGSQPRRGS
jgi:hypothetical protein